jgi:hypothetical protein
MITSTPTALTAEECWSYIHYVTNAADTTVTLPNVTTVSTGAFFICYMKTAYILTVDPFASDRINLNGVDLADGCNIISSGAVGNFITLNKDSDDGWTTVGRSGFWSAGS